MSVTAADMHRIRQDRSRVNHETYKLIYSTVSERIKTHGTMGGTDLFVQIPRYVPGRPIFDVSHATRYVAEKLTMAGFCVTRTDDRNANLHVSWKSVARSRVPKSRVSRSQVPRSQSSRSQSSRSQVPRSEPTARSIPALTTVDPVETAKRLELLKLKLKNLTR